MLESSKLSFLIGILKKNFNQKYLRSPYSRNNINLEVGCSTITFHLKVSVIKIAEGDIQGN